MRILDADTFMHARDADIFMRISYVDMSMHLLDAGIFMYIYTSIRC